MLLVQISVGQYRCWNIANVSFLPFIASSVAEFLFIFSNRFGRFHEMHNGKRLIAHQLQKTGMKTIKHDWLWLQVGCGIRDKMRRDFNYEETRKLIYLRLWGRVPSIYDLPSFSDKTKIHQWVNVVKGVAALFALKSSPGCFHRQLTFAVKSSFSHSLLRSSSLLWFSAS